MPEEISQTGCRIIFKTKTKMQAIAINKPQTVGTSQQELAVYSQVAVLGKKINPDLLSQPQTSCLILAMQDENCSLKDASKKQLSELNAMLLVFAGQKFETLEDGIENYAAYMPFLIKSFGSYKIEEIKLAYQLAREGKLFDEDGKSFKLFRELNYASACGVIQAYEFYKKDKLGEKIQNQTFFVLENNQQANELTEKSGVVELLSDTWGLYLKDKYNYNTGSFLYDYLSEKNIIDLSNAEKDKVQELASIEYVNYLERQRLNSDSLTRKKIDKTVQDLSNSSGFIFVCKYVAIRYQIEKWEFQDVTFEDIKALILSY